MLATGGPTCTEPTGLVEAAAFVALANKDHPFNAGEVIGPLTLFLSENKPAGSGLLTFGGSGGNWLMRQKP